jgi:uncharacterized protein (DUF58 family)
MYPEKNPMDNRQIYKQVRHIELVSKKLVKELASGNYRSVFKGIGIDFDEVREYVFGDDMRLIDWNVTSRMESPYTKIFKEERELNLFLVTDVSASLITSSTLLNKKEIALILFAVLAMSAIKHNDRVGGLFYSDKVEHFVAPAKGKKHVLRLINDLINFPQTGRGSNLKVAIQTLAQLLKRRGICVIISDFKMTEFTQELTLLAKKHDVIAIRIYDPVDYLFPSSTGFIELQDPETGKQIFSYGLSSSFRKRYKHYWEEQRTRWRTALKKSGIEILEISTSDDPAVKLMQFFRKRKR